MNLKSTFKKFFLRIRLVSIFDFPGRVLLVSRKYQGDSLYLGEAIDIFTIVEQKLRRRDSIEIYLVARRKEVTGSRCFTLELLVFDDQGIAFQKEVRVIMSLLGTFITMKKDLISFGLNEETERRNHE